MAVVPAPASSAFSREGLPVEYLDVFSTAMNRNIRVQLLTVVTLAFCGLLDGAVLIETVFGWPGLGQYLTVSLMNADMNPVVGATLLIGLIYVGLNLLADVLYRVMDPRVR